MKSSFLPVTWRKTLPLPTPLPVSPSRGRRALRLDQLLTGERGARAAYLGEEDGQFDGSWHESSRALAQGLLVREWDGPGASHEFPQSR